jgi:hypothetical protein
VVITSDRRLSACSFHHQSYPIATAADVLQLWNGKAQELRLPSRLPGCARVAGYGLVQETQS